MTQEHPITPPPELVQEWIKDANHNEPMFVQVAVTASRWGADQELDACCELLKQKGVPGWSLLRLHRRPEPTSLKEQALKELKNWTDEKHGLGGEVHLCEGLSVAIIRRALESLPD